jgi:hypothetical protein
MRREISSMEKRARMTDGGARMTSDRRVEDATGEEIRRTGAVNLGATWSAKEPTGMEPPAWGTTLFAALALYSFVFGRLTEAHTGKVRAAIWSGNQGRREAARQRQARA